jgi:formate dehydrogenase iron-sulfur subunit
VKLRLTADAADHPVVDDRNGRVPPGDGRGRDRPVPTDRNGRVPPGDGHGGRREGDGPRSGGPRAGVLDGIGVDGPELLPLDAGEQYRFTFAMDACVGCHSCEVACAEQNGLPVDTAWRRVGELEGGDHPRTRRFHLSMSCNHCLDPACLNGCPTEAYVKLANGVVQHHADECIGCQYCTWNCPYSVPVFQPDRRVVTKCDMCLPRLEDGLKPACVGACPTRALDVEKVDVAAWIADHAEADAPHLPPADLTLSTTRIALPADVPAETVAASDFDLSPEDPHWPLVLLTVLSQVAVGVTLTGTTGVHRLLAAGIAGTSLAVSLLHLGRPIHAYKALRNLRRSWLSREVALLGGYAGAAAATVVVPGLAPVAMALGIAGVFASGRLYVVPGRPSWNTPLTVASFYLTALAVGPLVTGHPRLAAFAVAAQLAVVLANLLRLRRDPRREWRGTVTLHWHPFRGLVAVRLVAAGAGIALALASDAAPAALPLVLLAELAGRYLFYVTVVPLNIPGSFTSRKRRHR